MEKFGIKNIKVVIGWGLDFGKEVSETIEDKKIKLFEALGFVDNAMSVEKLLKAAPQIKNEVSDLSEAETQELESWIHENYEFNNLTVNELIDATFDIFNGVTKIVAAFKK